MSLHLGCISGERRVKAERRFWVLVLALSLGSVVGFRSSDAHTHARAHKARVCASLLLQHFV